MTDHIHLDEGAVLDLDGQPYFKDCIVQLSEQDGNAFLIASRTRSAIVNYIKDLAKSEYEAGNLTLQERGQKLVQANLVGAKFFDEALSGDYDHVLQTVMKWVTVQ